MGMVTVKPVNGCVEWILPLATAGTVHDQRMAREDGGMPIERLEQIVALLVTAGLVAGNLVLFTPWRKGHEPQERRRDQSQLLKGSSQPSASPAVARPVGHRRGQHQLG